MHKITRGFILPSAAFTLKAAQIKFYDFISRPPRIGDVVYGQITRIGQHSTVENVSGRIHVVQNGTRGIFVFGNRYAPDFYEGIIPDGMLPEVDLLARSGVIGIARTKSDMVKDPTRVEVLGYVCNPDGSILNTIDHPLIVPKQRIKKKVRSPLILVCGTSMNSGKSMAAAACCWVLSSKGYGVRASKVTGTAGLKDILHMNDAGASHYSDFTSLGYPSTYLLDETSLQRIFDTLDLKYANNPKKFWIVELADGIIQRETSHLLLNPAVRSRIHKLIFCASDAFGAIGGLRVLKDRFGLVPDAISGVCSRSPLHIRELAQFTQIPVFTSVNPDVELLSNLLVPSENRKAVKHLQKAPIGIN
ncbi:MAG: hypothetical protein ABIK28_05920 [Planctomycetota bacterium]